MRAVVLILAYWLIVACGQEATPKAKVTMSQALIKETQSGHLQGAWASEQERIPKRKNVYPVALAEIVS